MPIQFAREPLTPDLWSEAMPLLAAHWAEVSAFPDIPLEPDVELYMAGEAAGILRVFTARGPVVARNWFGDKIGEIDGTLNLRVENGRVVESTKGPPPPGPLVGYALYFVRPNPHYKSSLQANQDVLYLAPSVRGKTGLKFIAWCDSQLTAEGVQVVYQHLKVKADHARLMAHLGYEPVDTIYAKRLDTPQLTDMQRAIVRLAAKGNAAIADYDAERKRAIADLAPKILDAAGV